MLRPLVIAAAMAFAAQADAQVSKAEPTGAASAVQTAAPVGETSQIPKPASIALLGVALVIGGIVLGHNIEIR